MFFIRTYLPLLAPGSLILNGALFGAQQGSAADTSPPTVDLQVVLERDAVKRGDAFAAFILVTNKSDTTLKDARLEFRGFGLDGTMPVLKDVAPYGIVP
jgi:hypothetical protein